MPEIIEVEFYRQLAERTVGRTIGQVVALDPIFLKGRDPTEVRGIVTGLTIEGTGRRGKLLWLETDGPRLGLRFGMTGRLLVDGTAAIERLEYSSARNDPVWDRVVLEFDDGTDLRLRDPRRLGKFELDPDLAHLGPDAATLTSKQLDEALGRSVAPLKARLLDQSRVAGLGNLLVDEILWRAGVAPGREAGMLRPDERSALAKTTRAVVRQLTRRGGSHTGDLHASRHRESHCPKDGTPLRRETVGGRTTYWCPAHQR